MPNGTVTTVTRDRPDLFFALKGGMNNFGIITGFTINAFTQGQVWVSIPDIFVSSRSHSQYRHTGRHLQHRI